MTAPFFPPARPPMAAPPSADPPTIAADFFLERLRTRRRCGAGAGWNVAFWMYVCCGWAGSADCTNRAPPKLCAESPTAASRGVATNTCRYFCFIVPSNKIHELIVLLVEMSKSVERVGSLRAGQNNFDFKKFLPFLPYSPNPRQSRRFRGEDFG